MVLYFGVLMMFYDIAFYFFVHPVVQQIHNKSSQWSLGLNVRVSLSC